MKIRIFKPWNEIVERNLNDAFDAFDACVIKCVRVVLENVSCGETRPTTHLTHLLKSISFSETKIGNISFSETRPTTHLTHLLKGVSFGETKIGNISFGETKIGNISFGEINIATHLTHLTHFKNTRTHLTTHLYPPIGGVYKNASFKQCYSVPKFYFEI